VIFLQFLKVTVCRFSNFSIRTGINVICVPEKFISVKVLRSNTKSGISFKGALNILSVVNAFKFLID